METRSKKRSRTLTGDQSGSGGGGDDDGEMSLKISQVCSVGDRIRRLKEGSEKEKIRFLEKGGWNLLHDWIQQSYSSGNFRLLEDILRGIQSLPSDPVKKMLEAGSSCILAALEEILKETVDQEGLEGMRELYNEVLTKWKDLVIVKRKLEEEEDDQGPVLKIKKKAIPLETSGSSEEEESAEIQMVSQKEPPTPEEDDDENEYVDVEALSEEESVPPTPPPPAKPPIMSVRDPRRKGIELQQAKELERVKRRKRRKRSTRKELEKALEEEKKQEKRFHGVVKREKRLMKKRAISKEDKKEGDKMNGILFKKKRKEAHEKPVEDVKPASENSVPVEEQRIIALEEDGGKRRSGRVAVFVSDKSRMEGIVKEMETKKIKYPQKTVARVLPIKKKDPRSEGQKKRVTFQVKPHPSTLPPVQLPVDKSLNLKEGTGKELVVFKPPPPPPPAPLPVVTSTSKELVPVVKPQNNCSTVATRRKAPPPPQISSNKALLLAIPSSTSSPSFKIHRIIKPPSWKLYKIHFPKIMERLRVRREERLNSDEKSIQAEREFLQTLKYPDEVPPSLLSCDSAMEPEQASDGAPTRPPHSTVKINSHSVRKYTEVFNWRRDYWPRPRSERKLTIVQCRFPPLMRIKEKVPALESTPKKPVELIDLTLSPEQTEVDKASGTTPTKAVGLPAPLPSPPKKQPQKYFLVRVPQLNPAKKPVLKIPSPPTVNAPTSPRRVSFKIAPQSSSSLVPYLPPTPGSTPAAALPEITLPIPMQSVLAASAQPPPESPPASPCLPLSLHRVTPPPSPLPKEPPPPPFQAVVPFPFQPPLPPEPPQVPRPPPPPPLPFTLQTRKPGKHQAQKLSVSPPRPLMSLGISPPPPFVPSTPQSPQVAPTTPKRARPTRFSTPPPQFNQFNFPPPPPGTTSPTPTALVPYRPPPVPPQQQYLSNYYQPTNPFLDYGYGFPQPNWNNSFQPYNSGGFGPFYENNNGGYRYVNNPFWQAGSQIPPPNRHPFGYWQF